MAEITDVIVLKIPDQNDYRVVISINEYDESEIMILKIEQNYYYPTFSTEYGNYEYRIKDKDPFISFDANIPLRVILYNYNKETVTDVKQGFVTLSAVSDFEIIALLPGIENNSSVWRNKALVESIEGSFQEDKLFTEIGLTKKAYYLDTTNLFTVSIYL